MFFSYFAPVFTDFVVSLKTRFFGGWVFIGFLVVMILTNSSVAGYKAIKSLIQKAKIRRQQNKKKTKKYFLESEEKIISKEDKMVLNSKNMLL